jgi:hypothetical protein
MSGWLDLTQQGLSPLQEAPSLAWRTNAGVDPPPANGIQRYRKEA